MTTPDKLRLTLIAILTLATAANADWPQFRGPSANGIVPGDPDLPLEWSETTNIAWKTPIPHRGWSSPVVADTQIWLTTATLQGNDYYAIAVDADSGQIIHNKLLFHADNPEPLGNNINCYASPTPVIDANRVYIHFGSYGTACIDAKTAKVIWQRTDIECRHYRGPGSSPIIFKNLLILTFDGVDVQFMIALDKKTGDTVWKTDRTADWNDLDANGQPFTEGDLRKAYSTPIIVDHKGAPQMLTIGAKAAYGYDPTDGREIWKINHTAYSAAAAPAYANSLAYLITGFGKTELWAARIDGSGDVTDTHIAWKSRQAIPRTPSLLPHNGLLYLIADNAILTCLDALTGDRVWTQRLKGDFATSPLYSKGRIYLSNKAGQTTVIQPGRQYKLLAENNLDTGSMASPAIIDNAIILRTITHLYKIQSPTKQ